MRFGDRRRTVLSEARNERFDLSQVKQSSVNPPFAQLRTEPRYLLKCELAKNKRIGSSECEEEKYRRGLTPECKALDSDRKWIVISNAIESVPQIVRRDIEEPIK
ncbi:hypothetical protein EVAR_27419_1 [Eumeta japonica]|uniref:Uncharacterized protein n=1 Tax=Eumeta variegata TaxID=151549 RepID=A0A4C1VKJ5_EUMVA|nr:hypothetical protein EVAR_27419_1 [Eumeta japonica]